MEFREAREILAKIRYKDGFRFELSYDASGNQMTILAMSHASGLPMIDSFKTVILPIAKMTPSDLVHRVFAEILSWEQHEACEQFLFEGVAIFSPHTDVYAIKEAISKRA